MKVASECQVSYNNYIADALPTLKGWETLLQGVIRE